MPLVWALMEQHKLYKVEMRQLVFTIKREGHTIRIIFCLIDEVKKSVFQLLQEHHIIGTSKVFPWKQTRIIEHDTHHGHTYKM